MKTINAMSTNKMTAEKSLIVLVSEYILSFVYCLLSAFAINAKLIMFNKKNAVDIMFV